MTQGLCVSTWSCWLPALHLQSQAAKVKKANHSPIPSPPLGSFRLMKGLHEHPESPAMFLFQAQAPSQRWVAVPTVCSLLRVWILHFLAGLMAAWKKFLSAPCSLGQPHEPRQTRDVSRVGSAAQYTACEPDTAEPPNPPCTIHRAPGAGCFARETNTYGFKALFWWVSVF